MKNKNFFAQNIFLLRKNAGLKQQDMQEKLGVMRNTWSNWENGKAEPDIKTICKIADFFELETGSLLSEDLSVSFKMNPNMVRELPAKYITSNCVECNLKEDIIASQKQTIKALEGQVDVLTQNVSTMKGAKKK